MRRLINLLCAVFALLAAIPLAFAQSEPLWARVVRPLLERQVPGLALEGLGGTLTRDPRAARITLADARGVWLTLEDAALVIDRGALFSGRVRLESITAARGVLARLPEGPAAPAPAPQDPPPDAQGVLPQLPPLSFGVQIDRLAIARFELGEPVIGLAATLSLEGRLAVTSGRLEAAFTAERLDAPGSLRLDLNLDPGANRLRAMLTLDEPPGGLIGTAAGLREHSARLALRLD
ncbi:MAG TPA: hypothetical protein VD970_13365, partial [Acetobacteraceae bacterium]|nr:hypothetical protein [Acetobacteraceae bacterium]